MPPHTKADMKARVDPATAELVRAAIAWREIHDKQYKFKTEFEHQEHRRKEIVLLEAIDALVEATDG